MIKQKETEIIGTGIAFPVKFAENKNDQLLESASGVDVINQSIRLIIGTRIGERYNNNEFGSSVNDLVFEPNDLVLKDLLYYSVVSALQRWEKRISILDVNFDDQTDNLINIVINYKINATHTVGSYVYPFVRNAMPMNEVIQGMSSFNLTSMNIRK